MTEQTPVETLDDLALEVARSIAQLDPRNMIGGYGQYKARIQCIVGEALRKSAANETAGWQIAEQQQIALRRKAEQKRDELHRNLNTARRDALNKAAAFAEAATICQKVKDGQDSLAWMHKEVSPDGDEHIGDYGIPYSNKALGAQHCVDDLLREEKKLRRQAEGGE